VPTFSATILSTDLRSSHEELYDANNIADALHRALDDHSQIIDKFVSEIRQCNTDLPDEVILVGSVDVYVTVSRVEKTVLKVVADDENFRYTKSHEGSQVVEDKSTPESAVAEALDIAETADWPVWDWGW
jgi:hypothetical protein